jgi:hypothetical protein
LNEVIEKAVNGEETRDDSSSENIAVDLMTELTRGKDLLSQVDIAQEFSIDTSDEDKALLLKWEEPLLALCTNMMMIDFFHMDSVAMVESDGLSDESKAVIEDNKKAVDMALEDKGFVSAFDSNKDYLMKKVLFRLKTILSDFDKGQESSSEEGSFFASLKKRFSTMTSATKNFFFGGEMTFASYKKMLQKYFGYIFSEEWTAKMDNKSMEAKDYLYFTAAYLDNHAQGLTPERLLSDLVTSATFRLRDEQAIADKLEASDVDNVSTDSQVQDIQAKDSIAIAVHADKKELLKFVCKKLSIKPSIKKASYQAALVPASLAPSWKSSVAKYAKIAGGVAAVALVGHLTAVGIKHRRKGGSFTDLQDLRATEKEQREEELAYLKGIRDASFAKVKAGYDTLAESSLGKKVLPSRGRREKKELSGWDDLKEKFHNTREKFREDRLEGYKPVSYEEKVKFDQQERDLKQQKKSQLVAEENDTFEKRMETLRENGGAL